MALRFILSVVTAAGLASGCALDWDGPRPLASVDGGIDGPTADSSAADAAPDQAPDLFEQDLPPPLPDTAISDATTDLPTSDAGPPCTYVYSGKAKVTDAVTEVNGLVAKGWKVPYFGFVHVVDDHAVWHRSGQVYQLLSGSDPTALTTALNKKVTSSLGGAPQAYLSNKGNAVWLKKGNYPHTYKLIVKSTLADAVTEVNVQALTGFYPDKFVHHTGKKHAAWLKKTVTNYAAYENDSGATLQTDVNLELAKGWTLQAFFADTGYAAWIFTKTAPKYFQLLESAVAVTIKQGFNKSLGANGSFFHSFVSFNAKHAAWLQKGQILNEVISSSDGPSLQKQINTLTANGYELRWVGAKEHNAVWLGQNCP